MAVVEPRTTKILQWNINGLRSRFPRLQYLIEEFQPKILILQEHKLNDVYFNYFKGFDLYSFCRPVAGGGGVCIAVHKNIPSTRIHLQTNLEAVACKVFFNDFILHICNVYFNDDADINDTSLSDLIDSIPSPKLILGDFNAHHPSWGSQVGDRRGDIVSNTFLDKNLQLLNDGSPTFYRASQDHYSHLDLTFCSNNIYNLFNWRVHHDRLSSDHFPIFLDYKVDEIYTTKIPRWKFEDANWQAFRNSVILPDFQHDHNLYNTSIIDYFKFLFDSYP